MADIKTSVLTIETGGAITNIKEFKQHIEDLKGKLLGLEQGTEEYNTVAKELQQSQEKLNQVMDVAKGKGESVKGSYDNLSATMRELKKQWKATNDEAERKALGKEILEINNQLKELDASTGVFSRNVGDYKNQFIQAFQAAGGGLKGVKAGVDGLSKSFKALLANPIVLLFTALAAAVAAVTKAIKGNEEQTNRLKVALAPLQPLIDGVKNAISAVAEQVVRLTEKISKLITSGIGRLSKLFKAIGKEDWAAALDGVINKMDEYTALTERETQLAEKRRTARERQSELELEIEELRAKIADKATYTEKQRIAFADEWEKKQKEILTITRELAEEELAVAQERASKSYNSGEENDSLSEARINLNRVKKENAAAERTINKTKSALLKGEADAINSLNNAFNNYKPEKIVDPLVQAEEKEKELVQQIIQRIIESNKTEIQKLTEKYAAEKALLEKHGQDTTALVAEYEAKRAEIENRGRAEAQERIAEINKRISESDKSEYELELQQLEEQYQAEKELFIQNGEDTLELELYYAEERKKIKDKEAEDDKERQRKQFFDTLQFQTNFAKSTASILQTAGDSWAKYIKAQVDAGKMSKEEGEKQFKQAKALQITTAIINTIAGAVGAFMGITRDTGGWGIAAAAAEAAAVTAAGAAQIATIANTKLGDSSTSSSISTPNVAEVSNDFTPQYTQNVTADSELTQLTNAVNSKISYVSVTDIENVQATVKTRDVESSY